MARRKLSDIVKADLEKIEKTILNKGNDIRVVVMNTVKSALVRRIFNDGQATNGQIGTYERSTKIFRNKIGRRIDKVDLEITGTLRRSIQLGTYKSNIVLGIVGNNEPKISFKRNKSKLNAFNAKKGKIKSRKGFRTAIASGLSDFQTTENAIWQEENFGKDIFAPTSDEINLGDKTLEKEINLAVKKAL